MKNIFKNIISFITYYTKLWHLLYALFPMFKRKHLLIVLTFHRVIPKEKTKHFFGKYDIGQDNKSYEILLEQINKFYRIISLNEFMDYIGGSKQMKQHSVLITFDDADNEFIEYALPILDKNKWPAVVFAPTGYIGTDERFWHLKISNMMRQMNNNNWQKFISNKTNFTDKVQKIIDKYPKYNSSLCRPLYRDLVIYLNSIRDDEIFLVVEQFEKIIESSYALGIKCMDWEQLKELEEKNIMIESHTKTHRKLEHLDDTDALAELKTSKFEIETKLQKEVKAFCYPAGSFNEKTGELVCDAGYKVAFTTQNGICQYPINNSALFKIPRISIGGKNRMVINLEIGRLLFNK